MNTDDIASNYEVRLNYGASNGERYPYKVTHWFISASGQIDAETVGYGETREAAEKRRAEIIAARVGQR